MSQTPYALGFTSLEEEVSLDSLPVDGELPPWLEGELIRTGPARSAHGSRPVDHWFDGLAMLHRFGFAGGQVSYANRFLDSEARRRSQRTGGVAFGEFATDPCRSIFQRVHSIFRPELTDNANVNVVEAGDHWVSMTETPMPVSFDPATLESLGIEHAPPGHITTAHPHLDPDTGERLNYATRFGPRSTYRVHAVDGAGSVREIATVPAGRPSYMHSFAVTERYVVLAEFPLVIAFAKLARGRPLIESFEWEPDRGTWFLVVDRRDGSLLARLQGPAMFAFHHVNAFEEGDLVHVDLCAYEDAGIVDDLYLDRLRGETGELHDAELLRCTLDLEPGAPRPVTTRRLSDTPIELPRINYGRASARRYRYAYGAARRPDSAPTEFINQLVKIDTEAGTAATWHEPGAYPGEPVFVARPGAEGEDDGACLSVVLDSERETSYLLALDAAGFEELARAELPHHVPFGFHGQFSRR